MRFKIPPVILLLAIIGAGCGKNSHDEEIQKDRVIKLLDERRCGDVIDLLEPAVNEPAHADMKPYLAEGYLCAAQYEPLGFAGQVMDDQPSAKGQLEELIPNCPMERVRDLYAVRTRCLVKRMLQHLPPLQEKNVERALAILFETFPDPARAPRQYNFLIGFLQMGRSVSRLGNVLTRYRNLDSVNASDADLDALFHEINLCSIESQATLTRIRFSGSNNGGGSAVFLRNRVSTGYIEQSVLPALTAITAESNPSFENAVARIKLLHKLDVLVSELQGP